MRYVSHWVAVPEQYIFTERGVMNITSNGTAIINLAEVNLWSEVVVSLFDTLIEGTLISYKDETLTLTTPFSEFHKMMKDYFRNTCNMQNMKRVPFLVLPIIYDENTTYECVFREDAIHSVSFSPDGDEATIYAHDFAYQILIPNLPNAKEMLTKHLNNLY